METTTQSYFWPVVWACAAGVVLLVGLLMEALADKKWHKTIGSFRRCESVKRWGEWLVVVGVLGEVVVGGITAANEWEGRPINLRITNLSAVVNVRVNGRNNVELPPHGSPAVAGILLCTEIVRFTNSLQISKEITLHDPSGAPQKYPLGLPGLPRLVANGFDVTKSSQFIGYGANPDFHEYVMQFHPEAHAEIAAIGLQKTAKAVDDIKAVWIDLKFLPHDSEILGGVVSVTVNNFRKVFVIPPQKHVPFTLGAVDGSSEFQLFTTNIVRGFER